jgi:hypothetical protein
MEHYVSSMRPPVAHVTTSNQSRTALELTSRTTTTSSSLTPPKPRKRDSTSLLMYLQAPPRKTQHNHVMWVTELNKRALVEQPVTGGDWRQPATANDREPNSSDAGSDGAKTQHSKWVAA